MPNAPIQPVSAPTGSNVAQGKQPYPGPQGAADIINERQANQDKRIAAGKAAGQISPQEEAQLNQMVEFINNVEAQANKANKSARKTGFIKAKGSGNINEKEFHEIMGMLDQLSDKIRISREAEDVAVRMPNAPIQPVVR
jgi:aminoglycoside phosphotransferase family enzyme